MGKKAVFLDKDGTLVENVPYNVDPEKVRLTRGAGPAIKILHDIGFMLVVVSNQSGVARGLFSEASLASVFGKLQQLVWAESGVPISGFYYCPHHPDGKVLDYKIDCSCRKPKPGMFLQAAKDLDIDLEQSWLIGDILDDIEAGKKACCKTILIDNGNETEWRLSEIRIPDYTAANLLDAGSQIMAVHEIFHNENLNGG